MTLLERRAEVLADHQAQEKYHPHWVAEAREGQHISKRPIAIHQGDDIVFVGDCVGKVLDGFGAFVNMVDSTEALQDKEKAEPGFALTVKRARTLLAAPPPGEFRIPVERWNTYLPALEAAGLTIVLTGM